MAKIVAKTHEGSEFMYDKKSAHKVSDRSADIICKALNNARFLLKNGEKWHVYEIGQWEIDGGWSYASFQAFERRRGYLVQVGEYTGKSL